MYTPNTPEERRAMLEVIGVQRMEDLFSDVPAKYRYPQMNLPPAMTEMEAAEEMQSLADANLTVRDFASFLGAGAYHHYVPAVVDHILRRGEFYTAYTPYQPEVSQGTLHAIFEFQSLVCALTGMEVSNASMYDGATAVAEAVNMAYHVFRGKRPKAVLSSALHPQALATVHTYYDASDREIVVPHEGDPTADPMSLLDAVDDRTSLVMVQYPDFFGRVYDFTELAEAVHAKGALFGIAVNPLALGLLKAPGDMGADIVTAEGQPLGIPLSFGGPYLGIFATRKKYVRKMAGRIVGETVDTRGQRAYVLTLTAREQHIRRARATSNICTNNALMALAATVYLGLLGKEGLRKVAELNYHKAHYAAQRLAGLEGYELAFPEAPFFNEFTLKTPLPVAEINRRLLDYGIFGGYDLSQDFPSLDRHMLVAVTEMNTKDEIDLLAAALDEIAREAAA
ncbi:MAG: aminomethyl-transferring glycine dehydrogenase subunit GcvPA [Chloroflexi bacterium]|nr:aminomethyl-transferring glycine dehydrogenase subunit GcvPA [Chloroflexota bacterium]